MLIECKVARSKLIVGFRVTKRLKSSVDRLFWRSDVLNSTDGKDTTLLVSYLVITHYGMLTLVVKAIFL